MSSILFVFSSAPHGRINAQEGLDALLMGSAFTTCSVVFVGEGVLQLVSGQLTDSLGTKNFALGFGALKDYGVSRIACARSDLTRYQLKPADLAIEVEMMEPGDIQSLIREHDQVLNF